MEDKKQFETTNYHLACFLIAQGERFLRLEKIGDKRGSFVFEESPRREQLAWAFIFAPEDSPDLQVSVRRFIAARKYLKDELQRT